MHIFTFSKCSRHDDDVVTTSRLMSENANHKLYILVQHIITNEALERELIHHCILSVDKNKHNCRERNIGRNLFENGIKAHTSEAFNNTLNMSRGRPEFASQPKDERRPFDTSMYVYAASVINHEGSLSHQHPQPGEEGLPPLQGQEQQRAQRKREMNVIHSRRKRERQKIEVDVLRDRCSQLSANNLNIFHKNKRLEDLLARANNVVSQSLAGGGNDDNNTLFPSQSCDDTHHSADASPAETTASDAATPTSTSSRLPVSLSSSSSSHVGVAGGGLLSTGSGHPPLVRSPVPTLSPVVSNNVTDGRTNSLYHLVQQQQHRQQQQQHRQQQQRQEQQQQLLQQFNHRQQQQYQQGDHQVQLAMLRRLATSSGIPVSESLHSPTTSTTTSSSSTSGAGATPLFGVGATGRLAGNMSDVPTLLQLQILRQHQEQQQRQQQQQQQQQQLATVATNHPTASYDQWVAREGISTQQQQQQQQYPNAFALGNFSGIPSESLARTVPDAAMTASLRALLSRNDAS
jgi:hypothetical protein